MILLHLLCSISRLAGSIAAVLIALSFNVLAEDAQSAPEDHPSNEIPMYGEVRLPEELQELNRKFVSEAYKTGISLTKSSNQAVDRGWEALNNGDTSTAIRRFNQAWLLDRRNGTVYWGFGVVLYKRDGDIKGALKMLSRAHRMQPKNPYLLVDYGRVLEENGKPAEAAILFLDAVSMDPNTEYAYVGLVRSYLKANDLESALLFAHEGKDRGDPISDELIKALEDLSNAGEPLTTEVKLSVRPEWPQ